MCNVTLQRPTDGTSVIKFQLDVERNCDFPREDAELIRALGLWIADSARMNGLAPGEGIVQTVESTVWHYSHRFVGSIWVDGKIPPGGLMTVCQLPCRAENGRWQVDAAPDRRWSVPMRSET